MQLLHIYSGINGNIGNIYFAVNYLFQTNIYWLHHRAGLELSCLERNTKLAFSNNALQFFTLVNILMFKIDQAYEKREVRFRR